MIAPVLCFIVALAQLILSQVSQISPWRGGGYGMYTEPPPFESRTVWLGLNQDGRETYFRINPPDGRIRDLFLKLKPHEKSLFEDFKFFGRKTALFPNRYSKRHLTKLCVEVLPILHEHEVFIHKAKPVEKEISIKVFEIGLTEKHWEIHEL